MQDRIAGNVDLSSIFVVLSSGTSDQLAQTRRLARRAAHRRCGFSQRS